MITHHTAYSLDGKVEQVNQGKGKVLLTMPTEQSRRARDTPLNIRHHGRHLNVRRAESKEELSTSLVFKSSQVTKRR